VTVELASRPKTNSTVALSALALALQTSVPEHAVEMVSAGRFPLAGAEATSLSWRSTRAAPRTFVTMLCKTVCKGLVAGPVS
jgi:hypothetical protein